MPTLTKAALPLPPHDLINYHQGHQRDKMETRRRQNPLDFENRLRTTIWEGTAYRNTLTSRHGFTKRMCVPDTYHDISMLTSCAYDFSSSPTGSAFLKSSAKCFTHSCLCPSCQYIYTLRRSKISRYDTSSTLWNSALFYAYLIWGHHVIRFRGS